MANTTMAESRHEISFWRSIGWSSGALAGLITGSILFFVSHGLPWGGSGAVNPTVMGLKIAPGAAANPSFFFGSLAIHMGISVLYGMLIGAIAHSFKHWVAGIVGMVVGLVLYFVDSALFAAFFSMDIPQRESAALLHHVAFGLIYKGMVRRHQPAPLM
jgi:tetrahydromethanopterin S-methyltransferase subunit G